MMNRLRVRVELNRRKAGVPMEELVSVVDETRKFFHLLAEDVQIESGRGEWLASNFDPESLNFTAEYEGAASTEQVQAFGSAFSGTTSLRRETIAQFTRIADFIGEDELVGFGLYQSDQETEPSDWRCLSRRDALRFSDEIRMLAQSTGTSEPSALPAVNGSVGGRRLFKDRREREVVASDPSKSIREIESNLSRKLSLLEGKVEDLTKSREDADERFIKLLGAMESFWAQAPKQFAAPAPAPAPEPVAQVASGIPTVDALLTTPPARPRRWWMFGVAACIGVLTLAATQYPDIAHQLTRSPEAASPHRAPEPAPVPAVPIQPVAVAAPEPAPPTIAEMSHQVSLEIPSDLKSEIESPVTVKVAVGIDPKGRVTAATVSSTKGAGADLLTDEALRAAHWFRFKPMLQGKKAVPSKTVLTFLFDPTASEGR
jgi:TonB family protein